MYSGTIGGQIVDYLTNEHGSGFIELRYSGNLVMSWTCHTGFDIKKLQDDEETASKYAEKLENNILQTLNPHQKNGNVEQRNQQTFVPKTITEEIFRH